MLCFRRKELGLEIDGLLGRRSNLSFRILVHQQVILIPLAVTLFFV